MIIDMFLEPEKTNPFFALALISICLIGALGTWFSATVILSELTLRDPAWRKSASLAH